MIMRNRSVYTILIGVILNLAIIIGMINHNMQVYGQAIGPLSTSAEAWLPISAVVFVSIMVMLIVVTKS